MLLDFRPEDAMHAMTVHCFRSKGFHYSQRSFVNRPVHTVVRFHHLFSVADCEIPFLSLALSKRWSAVQTLQRWGVAWNQYRASYPCSHSACKNWQNIGEVLGTLDRRMHVVYILWGSALRCTCPCPAHAQPGCNQLPPCSLPRRLVCSQCALLGMQA